MKATLILTVDIGDPANKEWAEQVLHENFDDLVNRAMGEGMITGDTDLEIEGYESSVTVEP
jgi:hypothetical protein